MNNPYPPGVSGTEPEIAGYDERTVEPADKSRRIVMSVNQAELTDAMRETNFEVSYNDDMRRWVAIESFGLSGSGDTPSAALRELEAAFLRALGQTVEIPEGD